jgi:DNA-binding response OmpR family regulator
VEALRQARTLLPDLIVLDLMLPELDGFTVCEILRHEPATASTRIIILTALPGELARVAGLGAGADEFLSKPFSPKQLLSRIGALLGIGQLGAIARSRPGGNAISKRTGSD